MKTSIHRIPRLDETRDPNDFPFLYITGKLTVRPCHDLGVFEEFSKIRETTNSWWCYGDVQGRTLDLPEGISHINHLYPHAMFGHAIHAWEDKSSTSFSLEAWEDAGRFWRNHRDIMR